MSTLNPGSLASRVRASQAGVLFDTNILLVHLARRAGGTCLADWKRTSSFADPGFVDLLDIVERSAKKIITTPHILAEASNLSCNPSYPSQLVMEELRKFSNATAERSLVARRIANDPAFLRLGVADCGLIAMVDSRWRRPLVVTDDAPLTLELERRKLPVLNLRHYQFPR